MDWQAGHADTPGGRPNHLPSDTRDEPELFAELATRLKEAHTRVRRLDLPDEAKVAQVRRLLVITDAAKHDLADAARRLTRLMEELESDPAESPGSPRDTAETLNPLRHKGDSPVR